MPFLQTSSVRHWAVFMAVMLLLGAIDLLLLQPELREAEVIAIGALAWVAVFVTGIVAIGLYQGTRSVRFHRSH
ncbi:MAG TPA: hypothetical protein PJ994_07930 [Tepidiformaceae bacterium]|nr:hypothetical protein [Tepidiformaceae bacterium]HMO96480.1 hypothetical protein [Tepidiformaceae bacterium]